MSESTHSPLPTLHCEAGNREYILDERGDLVAQVLWPHRGREHPGSVASKMIVACNAYPAMRKALAYGHDAASPGEGNLLAIVAESLRCEAEVQTSLDTVDSLRTAKMYWDYASQLDEKCKLEEQAIKLDEGE